jgi:hypothetical protein
MWFMGISNRRRRFVYSGRYIGTFIEIALCRAWNADLGGEGGTITTEVLGTYYAASLRYSSSNNYPPTLRIAVSCSLLSVSIGTS